MLLVRFVVLLVICLSLWIYAARVFSGSFFVPLAYAAVFAVVTLGLTVWLGITAWQLVR